MEYQINLKYSRSKTEKVSLQFIPRDLTVFLS